MTATRYTVPQALDIAAARRLYLDQYLNDESWHTPRDEREDSRGILNPDDFVAWMESWV